MLSLCLKCCFIEFVLCIIELHFAYSLSRWGLIDEILISGMMTSLLFIQY